MLASYLIDRRDFQEIQNKKILKSLQGEGQSSSSSSNISRALNYDYMISLIPKELGRNAASRRRRSQSQLLLPFCNVVEEEKYEGRFDASMQSHLSEIKRQMKNSLFTLEGYSVPNTRQLNARECFFDFKFDRVNEEIVDSSRESLLTPRGDSNNPRVNGKPQPRSSSHETPKKIIEFYSPVYLASIVLKHGVEQSQEQIQKYGLLERLEKSYDFNLLPK